MSAFEFKNYKTYMNKVLTTTGKSRGMRSKLAERLGCNVGFISQVLKGDSHFSFEHSVEICDFLNLYDEERDYFLLLVHYAKAGSHKLKQHYTKEIDALLAKREEIKNRVKASSKLTDNDYAEYYSHAYIITVHMALSIPEYQTKDALINKFGLTHKQLIHALNFLSNRGLIIEKPDGGYKTGTTRIHLSKESPFISKHHTNWRMEAIKALDKSNEDNMHYSSVLTLSKKDYFKIKDILLNSIESVEKVLLPSKDEELVVINIDLFNLRN